MSDIWHTPPEQPDPFKSWSVLVVYEANDRKEMMYSTQFIHATDGMYVNRSRVWEKTTQGNYHHVECNNF